MRNVKCKNGHYFDLDISEYCPTCGDLYTGSTESITTISIDLTGKRKCDELRKLRKMVADMNGIDYPDFNCPNSADCKTGTCEKCDRELEEITRIAEKNNLLLQVTYTPSEDTEMPEKSGAEFCTNCGTELKEGARYCRMCGEPVRHFNSFAAEPMIPTGGVPYVPTQEIPPTGTPYPPFETEKKKLRFGFRKK